ncbi:transposase domain-containing protein [Gigaspora margarita]|uniref:Transposase domain-containing protein n=1 Tax=Gigaspora margarita TaxID=4874 RepID=A0A8H3X5Y9_GIGMA|nr:transposase domain-containing protein [Gigaspora margarita]
MHRFLFNTYNIQESVITSSERFSGKLLPPQQQKLIIPAELLDLLIEYYTAAYENLSYRKPFADNLDDSIIVLNQADHYSVNLLNGFIEHKLVYIKWYKPVSSAATRFHISSNDNAKTCNVELWNT